MVAFLCSPLAAYVTGQNIGIDGGSLLPSHQSDELLRALLDGDRLSRLSARRAGCAGAGAAGAGAGRSP